MDKSHTIIIKRIDRGLWHNFKALCADRDISCRDMIVHLLEWAVTTGRAQRTTPQDAPQTQADGNQGVSMV